MKKEDFKKAVYRPQDEDVNNMLGELAHNYAAGMNAELLREMFVTIAKIGEEQLDVGDLKLINTTLKELRYAFKVFSEYRTARKVAIFDSARSSANSKEYKMAERFAKDMVRSGFLVITGSGPGIMEAGNKGAGTAHSFGVNIRVPFEQKPNPYIAGDAKLINFKYFFTRKLIFIKESDATVLFPGGFGTLDEGFEAITLFQTGKCKPRPILLLEPAPGRYWKNWFSFVKDQMLKSKYISKDDLSIFKIINSTKEAIEEIHLFYKNYNSIRYIKDLTVMRLNKQAPDKLLAAINKNFKDIITGAVKKTGPLEEELQKKEHLDLPRIKMRFNRRDFGRLNELIRFINTSY